MSTRTALVTGDIVLDCHLYGGVKTAANSLAEPGTVYKQQLGGAALSQKILASAADAKGLSWEAKKKEWDDKNAERAKNNAKRMEENRKRKAEGKTELLPIEQLPWPDDLEAVRPRPAYATSLGIDDSNLMTTLPKSLHSFGVWTSHPVKKGTKAPADPVWRVQKHFGYGPAETGRGPSAFTPAKSLPPGSAILVDDGGILFRHEASQLVWPNFSELRSASNKPFVVLKMSAPLCRGDLWPRLIDPDKGVPEQLIVVVSAAELRHEDAQIRQHLSWEQCAADTLIALNEDPTASQLLRARHVIVNFGSAGALWLHREKGDAEHRAELVFDPVRLEGDFSRDFTGTVYGFQSCLAVAITHHLMMATPEEIKNGNAFAKGITSGLQGRRKLLELGHGTVGKGEPGFPIAEVGQTIAGDHGGFVRIIMPSSEMLKAPCQWSILADSQQAGTTQQPHIGLAQLTAIHGRSALSHAPSLTMDNLFSVDRSEIESLRTLDRLVRQYEQAGVQKKPLSIGVFGPPGAGKSFGVKALARAILGEKVPFLEFNLSQFKGPDELIGAFHRVRDEVLKGTTPVAFWDEFDSQSHRWLQYLLAPMQDGSFQEGQVTHPIGKCIFIFAGGTAHTLEDFGVKKPAEMSEENREKLEAAKREQQIKKEEAYKEFKLLKGPDFISRLHGHLNVLGPNPPEHPSADCPDLTWPIRRALMLRGVLGLKDDPKKPDGLDMDAGLLFALLTVSRYEHGSRSFEKILLALHADKQDGHYQRSALPPDPLLERETNAVEFHDRMNQRNAFKTNPDIEKIAAAIHKDYLQHAKKEGFSIKAEVDKDYQELGVDYQAANRAAARRIPDLLSLIDFKLLPLESGNTSWKDALVNQIGRHRDRLAQAEHLGWNAERRASGWSFAPERNDDQKQHNLLVDWTKLSESEKDKDRKKMDAIPIWLELAGYMAVPV